MKRSTRLVHSAMNWPLVSASSPPLILFLRSDGTLPQMALRAHACALLLTLSSQIHVLPCQLLRRVVMKRTALIPLLVDAVDFCRRGLTTKVLFELRGLTVWSRAVLA